MRLRRYRRVVPESGRARGLVLLGLLVCSLVACGGGGSGGDPTVLRAGQLDIKLPPGYKVVEGKVVTPPGAGSNAPVGAKPASGASAGSATATTASGTTVPLSNSQDPTTGLFSAFGKFRKCLDDLGVKFLGAPDQSNPNSPTNDPSYVKNLSTCAARSNIVQALQSSQTANDNLTPAQIKQQNKGYLKWRSCMIDRGWKIPEPTPDSQGRLFSFGASASGGSGSGGAGAQITPPAGKDLLTSSDLQQCAAKAQKSVGH